MGGRKFAGERVRATFAISAGLLAAMAGVAWASSSVAPAPAAKADAAFEGVTLWDFRGSNLAGVGTAHRLVYDRSAGTAVATVATANLPGVRNDPRPVRIEAGTATGQVKARTIDLTGGVKLIRVDGTAISHSAHYDGVTRVASGHEAVELQSDRFHATGSGFTYNSNSAVFDLDGPVDAKGRATP